MFKKAIDFSNKIKDFENIISIILFGSVARNEATRESDVDIAIIYSKKNHQTIRKINNMKPEEFQLIHLTIDELKDEPTFTGALSGEGILLYGRPVTVSLNDMELKSKMIIAYNTSKLDQNSRNKLNRALNGGKSTYIKENNKKETKFYPGIIDEIRAEKIGKGVLIIDRKNYPEIIKTLKIFNAKWKEIPVWTY
jgi:predicted nucleotidyltransferase